MLSRIVRSARGLFISQSKVETNPEQQQVAVNTTDTAGPTMVTTRGQGARSSLDPQTADDPAAADSNSARKRQRTSSTQYQTSQKDDDELSWKELAVREKDEEEPVLRQTRTRLVVEIPVIRIASDSVLQSTTSSEVTSQEQDVGLSRILENGVEIEDSESDGSEGSDIPAQTIVENEAVAAELSKNSASAAAVVDDSESKDGNERMQESALKATAASGAKKTNPTKQDIVMKSKSIESKHKRFGSEDPEPLEHQIPATGEVEDVAEESSDDDAPEVVAIGDAAKVVKSKARDTARAVEELVPTFSFMTIIV